MKSTGFVFIFALLALNLAQAQTQSRSVLVFSKTTGFRHTSIEPGIAALRELGNAHGFQVTATEDAGQFKSEALRSYAAVVFLSTTGDVLDLTQQRAFETYVESGGGFVGVHSAADTEYEWPGTERSSALGSTVKALFRMLQ